LGIALSGEADHVRERHAAGGVLDSEIAVMRIGPQAIGLEVGGAKMARHELVLLRLPSPRCSLHARRPRSAPLDVLPLRPRPHLRPCRRPCLGTCLGHVDASQTATIMLSGGLWRQDSGKLFFRCRLRAMTVAEALQ